MAVCDLQKQLDVLNKMLYENCYHPFLEKHIKLPNYDADRVMLLSHTLQNVSVSRAEKDAYITAAMLAQFALDVHEDVTNPHISMKQRQLAVLAGDYFSGKYYSILAKYHNIELIKKLASAIKTINEQKIYVYRYKGENIESFIESIKKIESNLTVHFCRHFNCSEMYHQFIVEFLFLKRAVIELENIISEKDSIFLKGLKQHNLDDSTNIKLALIEEFSKYIDQSKSRVMDLTKELSELPSLFQLRLDEVTKQFASLLNPWVEEM